MIENRQPWLDPVARGLNDALGVEIVHRLWGSGLAHRDIKPPNLMVRDGRLYTIDVAFAQVRPSPWRQAVDLVNAGQLRDQLAPDGRDLIEEFRRSVPTRPPVKIQRWSVRRLALAAWVGVVGAVEALALFENLHTIGLPP